MDFIHSCPIKNEIRAVQKSCYLINQLKLQIEIILLIFCIVFKLIFKPLSDKFGNIHLCAILEWFVLTDPLPSQNN